MYVQKDAAYFLPRTKTIQLTHTWIAHGQDGDFAEVIRLGEQLQHMSHTMEDMGKVQVGGLVYLSVHPVNMTLTYLWGRVANAEYNK